MRFFFALISANDNNRVIYYYRTQSKWHQLGHWDLESQCCLVEGTAFYLHQFLLILNLTVFVFVPFFSFLFNLILSTYGTRFMDTIIQIQVNWNVLRFFADLFLFGCCFSRNCNINIEQYWAVHFIEIRFDFSIIGKSVGWLVGMFRLRLWVV